MRETGMFETLISRLDAVKREEKYLAYSLLLELAFNYMRGMKELFMSLDVEIYPTLLIKGIH